jgi:VanZ family protein
MLSPRVFVHLFAFAAFLALMTWKLLEPRPVPEALTESLSGDWLFILAKCFHAGAYAFMTVLGATAPVSRRWRVALVGLMFLHGVGTEIGQTYVPNRTGKVTDVLIDWAGITAGLLAVRHWSSRVT